jgi:hypothetical protein
VFRVVLILAGLFALHTMADAGKVWVPIGLKNAAVAEAQVQPTATSVPSTVAEVMHPDAGSSTALTATFARCEGTTNAYCITPIFAPNGTPLAGSVGMRTHIPGEVYLRSSATIPLGATTRVGTFSSQYRGTILHVVDLELVYAGQTYRTTKHVRLL